MCLGGAGLKLTTGDLPFFGNSQGKRCGQNALGTNGLPAVGVQVGVFSTVSLHFVLLHVRKRGVTISCTHCLTAMDSQVLIKCTLHPPWIQKYVRQYTIYFNY